MTHCIDKKSEKFELDSQEKKYFWHSRYARKDTVKVIAALGVVTALTSPAVANVTNSQYLTNNNQTQQTVLTANDPDSVNTLDKGWAIYIATPQELDGISTAMNAAIKCDIDKDELDNLISSIVSIKDNAIEELNRQAYLLGGASGLKYAINKGAAGAEVIAEDFVKKYGLSPKTSANVARIINKLNSEYKNLTPSVIAIVVGNHSRKDSWNWDWKLDTDIGDGLEYLDNEVNNTLKALNDRSATTSYERIKDAYQRCKAMMFNLGEVETSVEMAMKHYNTHMRDLTAWGSNPKDETYQKWLKEDAENTNKYAYIAGQKALEAFENLGSFYNDYSRAQSWEEAKRQSQSNTATQSTKTKDTSALEKAIGYGVITE